MSDKLRELVKRMRETSEYWDTGWVVSGWCDELEALLPTEPVADVAVDNDGWIAFADRWPPKSPALDDPSVETRDTVLVTNSINARDRMGRMSHVWLGMPQQQDGEIMCFEGSSYRTVHGLTHWKPINYTTPTEPAPDREDAERWINDYGNGDTYIYASKAIADEQAEEYARDTGRRPVRSYAACQEQA